MSLFNRKKESVKSFSNAPTHTTPQDIHFKTGYFGVNSILHVVRCDVFKDDTPAAICNNLTPTEARTLANALLDAADAADKWDLK